jgi:hypothetical protein
MKDSRLKVEIAQRSLSDLGRKPSVILVHHHQAIEAGDNVQLSLLMRIFRPAERVGPHSSVSQLR